MRGSIIGRVLSCPLGACATSGDAGLQIGCSVHKEMLFIHFDDAKFRLLISRVPCGLFRYKVS
jgi:hypothetical protein